MNTPPHIPYQAYKVRPYIVFNPMTESIGKKIAKETFAFTVQQQAVCLAWFHHANVSFPA